jgi:hypothetical protein
VSQSKSKNALWRTFKSVAASAFGVQTQNNLQQDFEQPSAVGFIVIGIVFVVLFVARHICFFSVIHPTALSITSRLNFSVMLFSSPLYKWPFFTSKAAVLIRGIPSTPTLYKTFFKMARW